MECQLSIMDALAQFQCLKEQKDKKRYLRNLIIIITIYIIFIIIGIILFKYIFDINWIDSWLISTMLYTGIDLEVTPVTDGQKVFIIIYSIIAILLLLSMANIAVQYFFNVYT